MQDNIQHYITDIKKIPHDKASEATYRSALETFLNNSAPTLKNITVVQEASDSKSGVDGTPDFFIYEDVDSLFKTLKGFVECKKPDYNLEKLLSSAQVKKYEKTCENIILTNYREFTLLQKGKVVGNACLLDKNFHETADENAIQNLKNLIAEFYGYDFTPITSKKLLVEALATQSFYYSVALRQYIGNKNNKNSLFHRRFKTLFEDFQQSVHYNYQLADFCDVYAQSLVYGLLIARLESDNQFSENTRNYLENIPQSHRLLYEFLNMAYDSRYLPMEIRTALTNIGKNLNLINIAAIENEFAKNKDGKDSIAVYLYEDFLKRYDDFRGTEKRKEGGVYYTPKEACDFIVRGVNDLLKSDFAKTQGFLATGVKTLDFACGTGTFLNSVFDVITQNMHDDDLSKQQVKNKILNDIYGFELLFPPYIVAHTLLTNRLKKLGIDFRPEMDEHEKLGIYLTNTLDIDQHSISGFLPHMQNEHEKATKIKNNEDILAIIGNPPYFNGKSQSQRTKIDDLLKDYKRGLNEKKINLDDVYIKFIRFAEHKINQSGKGVVGIIVNNSFLDGVTHRRMRQQLHETFNDIYILNLHGNTRRGEGDQNIFDIKVGVAIVFFVKNAKESHNIYYHSLKDQGCISRADKLHFLKETQFKKIEWRKLNIDKNWQLLNHDKKYYWFTYKDLSEYKNYKRFYSLNKIFNHYNSGIETKKDKITISYNKGAIQEIVNDFKELDIYEIKQKYNIEDGVWTVQKAKNSLCKEENEYSSILPIAYRPYDERHTFLNKESSGFLARPRYETMQHFENKENFGLCFERIIANDSFNNIFISQNIIDGHLFGSKIYIAPLYIFSEKNGTERQAHDYFYDEVKNVEGEIEIKISNFTPEFSKFLQNLNFQPTPEQVLYYIYAVMHAPIYREKYIAFLKIDFPAVPITENKETFIKYAKIGEKLANLHLLRDDLHDKAIKVNFTGDMHDFVIDKITPPTGSQYELILTGKDNRIITFNGVTPAIYNYEIGSYNPIDKWLKYRKKDEVVLNHDDLAHIKNMCIAIKETIAIQDELEKLGEEYLQS